MKRTQTRAPLAEADVKEPVHRIKGGWKGMITFIGVLVSPFAVTLPFGIWCVVVAAKARLGVTDEGFAIRGFGTRGHRWEGIAALERAPLSVHGHGYGAVGALVGAAASKVGSAKTEGLAPISHQLPAATFGRTGATAARSLRLTWGVSTRPHSPPLRVTAVSPAAARSRSRSGETRGLEGPLSFKVRGKRIWTRIPAHVIERGGEMARQMEAHTGLTLLPPEPEVAGQGAPDPDASTAA